MSYLSVSNMPFLDSMSAGNVPYSHGPGIVACALLLLCRYHSLHYNLPLMSEQAPQTGFSKGRIHFSRVAWALLGHAWQFGEDMLDFVILLTLHPATLLCNRSFKDCIGTRNMAGISEAIFQVVFALLVETAVRFKLPSSWDLTKIRMQPGTSATVVDFILSRIFFVFWVAVVHIFGFGSETANVNLVTTGLWLLLREAWFQ